MSALSRLDSAARRSISRDACAIASSASLLATCWSSLASTGISRAAMKDDEPLRLCASRAIFSKLPASRCALSLERVLDALMLYACGSGWDEAMSDRVSDRDETQ